MKKTRYPELKQYLKNLAFEIRKNKNIRDNYYLRPGQVQGPFQWEVQKLAWEFRHQHIAYCMLYGTPYEKIEQPRYENKPDMDYVRDIMESYEQPKTELRAV